jgi:glycosyltransferase involved in cell wall biosynthesis
MRTTRPRVCFIVESGTDVRLVEGLAEFADLTVIARTIAGGVEISQPARAAFRFVRGPASFAGFGASVYRFIRRERQRIDFVLVQGYGIAAAAANLAARLVGLPSAMLVCSPVEAYYRCRRGQTGFGKPFRRVELVALSLLARINARLGSRYIVLSQHLREVVRAHGNETPADLIPVYGVDTAIFKPSDRPRAEIRRRRGIPEAGSVLFFSSRVAPEKDAATVLAAMARLVTGGRDVYLLHRSGGFRRLLAEADACGLASRVIATAAVHPHEELPLDYAASDVCVQASRAEGLGYSVLEALACGVPVVATRVGGLAETVVDGVTGWTCPPGDADAMARRIAEVLDNPVEGRRRALAGRHMVEARYARERVFGDLRASIVHSVRQAERA